MTANEFTALVARMTKDGEGIDGRPFVQPIEDAFMTLGGLIDQARAVELTAESAQPEPADKQTRQDLIDALKWAIVTARDSMLRKDGKPNDDGLSGIYKDRRALIKRWEAIRDDLTAQELAQ